MEEMRLKSTYELAKVLGIKSYDENKMSLKQIIDNVSPTIRPKVKAAIELYKRSLERNDIVTIKRAEDVLNIVRPLMMDLEHEECWALMIDSANQLKSKIKISSGSLSCCQIDVNGICRNALMSKAVAVIIAHNHPSGVAVPGEKDISETMRLKKALKLIDCSLLDHVIVAKGGDAYSFAEEETIKYRKV